MKWYKHITTSLQDPFISELMDEYGSDGYLVFFGILEIVARESKSFDSKVSLKLNYCSRLVRLRRDRLKKILLYISTSGRFLVDFEGDTVKIKIPKLKELSDEWSKKKLHNRAVVDSGVRSGASPESLRPIDIDKDIDKDKDMYIVVEDIHKYYCGYVEKEKGVKPVIRPEHERLIPRLLKDYSPELIKEAIKVFVDSDPEADKIGYSLNAFYSRLNANIFEAEANLKRASKKTEVIRLKDTYTHKPTSVKLKEDA